MRTLHPGTLASHPAGATAHIAPGEPLRWLSHGYRDFRSMPRIGLTYGLMVTLTGWLVFALGNHPYFVAAALSGFLLVGPILAAGLIEASRTADAGQAATFESSLRGLDRNRRALERFALALLTMAVAWMLLSAWMLNATVGPIAPSVERTLWDSALRMMSSEQWLAWSVIGGVLAIGSFAISVIAVPLILDRGVSAAEAMRGSLRAVARHPFAAAGWALLIAVLTAVGIATALIGFVVIYPVLGHASWHAYNALGK